MIRLQPHTSPKMPLHHMEWRAGFVCPAAVVTASQVHMAKGNRRRGYAIHEGRGTS